MLQALSEIGRIRSVRYRLSDGIFGLLSYSSPNKTPEQENEIRRRLEHFKTFIEYFETIDAYDKARSESDTKQIKALETKLLENADVYAGLASIFKNGEREAVRSKLSKIEIVVDSILSGTKPPTIQIQESLVTLKDLRKEVEEKTSDDEKTAERMIYGSIPTF
jgi:hypothetical protein